MEKERAIKTGNSGAEEQFVQLFCEVFGAEQGEYVYLQFPFLDIYGKHRTITFPKTGGPREVDSGQKHIHCYFVECPCADREVLTEGDLMERRQLPG